MYKIYQKILKNFADLEKDKYSAMKETRSKSSKVNFAA